MKEIIKKLQIKDGQIGKIINLPNNLRKNFDDWPKELLSNKKTSLDFVIIFVKNVKEIERYAGQSIELIRTDGLLWFAYPKKTSEIQTDISRDNGWELLSTLEYRPVRLISLDKNWSVLRFREKSLVR